jgi:hypothetical protein
VITVKVSYRLRSYNVNRKFEKREGKANKAEMLNLNQLRLKVNRKSFKHKNKPNKKMPFLNV